jgi:hypothetical protein
MLFYKTNRMKTATAILAISFCLTTSAFAQTAIADLSPDKMQRAGLLFSVQATVVTNATQFTVTVSCTKRRVHLPEKFYATLRTEAEPPILKTEIINGQTVRTRAKLDNEKGNVIPPSSAATNQTNAIVYSFPVPNDKLENATFMWWLPNPPSRPNMIPETCCRIRLKAFTEKKEGRTP